MLRQMSSKVPAMIVGSVALILVIGALTQLGKLFWVCAAFAVVAGLFGEVLLPWIFYGAVIGVVAVIVEALVR